MLNKKTLINFNVPITLRNQFDAICQKSGLTRTTVLMLLMKKHIDASSGLLSRNEIEDDNLPIGFYPNETPDIELETNQF